MLFCMCLFLCIIATPTRSWRAAVWLPRDPPGPLERAGLLPGGRIADRWAIGRQLLKRTVALKGIKDEQLDAWRQQVARRGARVRSFNDPVFIEFVESTPSLVRSIFCVCVGWASVCLVMLLIIGLVCEKKTGCSQSYCSR